MEHSLNALTRRSICIREHYSASDSIWGTWTDSEIRQWLSDNGYLEGRNDVQSHRDLVDLINTKCVYLSGSLFPSPCLIFHRYSGASAKVASYLVWPDARLRAYLRERGISEIALPTSRPGLLRTSETYSPHLPLNACAEETRIHWVQTSTRTETTFMKLKEIVNSSVEAVEEKIARVLEVR